MHVSDNKAAPLSKEVYNMHQIRGSDLKEPLAPPLFIGGIRREEVPHALRRDVDLRGNIERGSRPGDTRVRCTRHSNNAHQSAMNPTRQI